MAVAKTLEEKNATAEEAARKKNEKEGLGEAATKALIDEKVKDVEGKTSKESVFVIEVKNNPTFCGVGAGGVQFANGKAEIISKRMADWFREHDGYTVTEK